MSQSTEEAEEELKAALDFGRCQICDGMIAVGYPGSCTCCANCGNLDTACLCCKHCYGDPSTCRCTCRITDIWKESHICIWCVTDSQLFGGIIHQVGERCPLCCAYCKEFLPNCKCCKKCSTAPCICCTICGDLRINCKCKSARVLSHFIRRAVLNHKIKQ